MKRTLSGIFGAAMLALTLQGCGGGTPEERAAEKSCGGASILASLNYGAGIKTAVVGTAVTFRSFVTPASCEGDMVFGIKSGSLPPGLGIQANGYIFGNPTTVGTYTADIVIVRVNGYADFSLATAPSSRVVIVVTK